jgi:hypothetical protein
MSIVLDGTTGLAGAATGALNGALGATTPSTVAATTVTASSTIKGATTIAVGNATPSASGAGITFPATQSASTDANTLDDYEEGTYTVSVTMQTSGSVTLATGFTTLSYTKIGRLVNIIGMSRIQSVSSPVGALIYSLPFPARNGTTATSRAGGAITYFDNSVPTYIPVPIEIDENTSSCYIFQNKTSVGAVAASDELLLSITYITD